MAERSPCTLCGSNPPADSRSLAYAELRSTRVPQPRTRSPAVRSIVRAHPIGSAVPHRALHVPPVAARFRVLRFDAAAPRVRSSVLRVRLKMEQAGRTPARFRDALLLLVPAVTQRTKGATVVLGGTLRVEPPSAPDTPPGPRGYRSPALREEAGTTGCSAVESGKRTPRRIPAGAGVARPRVPGSVRVALRSRCASAQERYRVAWTPPPGTASRSARIEFRSRPHRVVAVLSRRRSPRSSPRSG